MKIAIFSGKLDDPNRIKALKACASMAQGKQADLLLLPGHSFKNNYVAGNTDYSPQDLADDYNLEVISEIRSASLSEHRENSLSKKKKHKESLNTNVKKDMETKDTIQILENKIVFPWKFYLFSPKKTPLGPIYQHFATSHQAYPERVKIVLNEFSNNTRVFHINGIRLGILLCGEINILFNKQDNANKVSVRHGLDFPLEYDVLLNPSHDNFGNMGKMHERFKYLSRNNRTFITTTNNKFKSWKSAAYVFQNGNMKLNGNNFFGSHPNWRMAIVDV